MQCHFPSSCRLALLSGPEASCPRGECARCSHQGVNLVPTSDGLALPINCFADWQCQTVSRALCYYCSLFHIIPSIWLSLTHDCTVCIYNLVGRTNALFITMQFVTLHFLGLDSHGKNQMSDKEAVFPHNGQINRLLMRWILPHLTFTF